MAQQNNENNSDLFLDELIINVDTAISKVNEWFDDKQSLIQPINAASVKYPPLKIKDIQYILNDIKSKLELLKSTGGCDKDDLLSSLSETFQQGFELIEHIKNNPVSDYDNVDWSTTAFIHWIYFLSMQVNSIFSFDVVNEKKLLPANLKRRLLSYEDLLCNLNNSTVDIEDKVKNINDAYDVSINLPILTNDLKESLKELNETKEKMAQYRDSIVSAYGKIETYEKNSEQKNALINEKFSNLNEEINNYLEDYKKQAEEYINKCEDAYRTTTSSGLAKAFEDKANKLNGSVRWWVGFLAVSLSAAAGIGFWRLTSLEATLSKNDVSAFIIIVQILLSSLSLGLPLWFAWLATKQIGQRFRLAEDYEYKSAVSKAYEGYRREAVSLNEKFEDNFPARLFDNALTRLEEPPVRFVDDAIHSSPIMEFLNSEKVRNFVKRNPEKTQDAIDAISRARYEGEKDKEKKDSKEKGNEEKDRGLDNGDNKEKNNEDSE